MLFKQEYNNDYLTNFNIALDNVDKDYISQEYNKVIKGFQKPERIFTSELYHQLRVQKLHNNNIKYNTEPNKRTVRSNNSCLTDLKSESFSPDIILHKNQNNSESYYQILACEIKMENASQKKIIRDFRKLLYYKIHLNYQNSIFVYTGNIKRIEAILNTEISGNLQFCLKQKDILVVTPIEFKEKLKWTIYSLNQQKK